MLGNTIELIERLKRKIKEIKEENIKLKNELMKERESKLEALKRIDELIEKLKTKE